MVKAGDIVISKQGHDEGRLYVVVATVNADFCLVCDGHYRKIDKPKLKRIKHLTFKSNSCLASDLITNGKLTDANLVFELKTYKAQAQTKA